MGVSAIAHKCLLLNSINLHRCEEITDVGVSAMAHKCPCLRDIRTSLCVILSSTLLVDNPRLNLRN